MKNSTAFLILLFLIVLSLPSQRGVAGDSPHADFDVKSDRIIQPESYCWEVYEKEEVVFIAVEDDDEGYYRWDFGDGDCENTEQSVTSHVYNRTGVYTVILEVDNGDHNNTTKEGRITVVERPLVHLVLRDPVTNEIIDPTLEKIPMGKTIQLDASGSQGEIMTYYFGLDLHATFIPQKKMDTASANHSYDTPGEYRIGARVVDRLGSSSQTGKEDLLVIHVIEEEREGSDEGYIIPVSYTITLSGGPIILGLVIGFFLMHQREKPTPPPLPRFTPSKPSVLSPPSYPQYYKPLTIPPQDGLFPLDSYSRVQGDHALYEDFRPPV